MLSSPLSEPLAESLTEGRATRLLRRLHGSLPSPAETLFGSACWALAMAASAMLGLLALGWQTPQKYLEVATLYGIGAALGFPAGLVAARFIASGRPGQSAFASAFLGLSFATFGFTALAFALHYRQYYATWHGEALSLRWVFEFLFTSLGAFAQFAVLGSRLFFPVGFAALFVAALWVGRRTR
jgi:hypothetical protein